MPDLQTLADLGRQSVAALWLPVALWTAVALAVELGLRIARSRAALALPVRGAVLAALPLSVGVPAAVSTLPQPAAAARWAPPSVQWLPDVWVGAPPPAVAAAAPPLGDVLLGLAVVLVALAGAVGVVRLLGSLARAGALRRGLVPASEEIQAAVDHARRQLGVARPVRAVLAPEHAAPFTLGWRRPLVALPPGLAGDAAQVAVTHEVAHVRRADYAWHLAQRALTAVCAAHPLAWVLARGLDVDRERAVDAIVLDACPGRRRTYADLLFSYAALPAPPLALGAVGGSSSLKSRVEAMTSPLPPRRLRQLARWGRLLGVLALASASALAATTVAPALSDVTFQLVDPVYQVDGQQFDGAGSISDAAFRYYVLDLAGVGRWVVSAEPFPGSSPTGRFEDRVLRAEAGGHSLVVRSAAPLFPDGAPSAVAHVRFEAGDASAAGAGFVESLPHTLEGLGPVGAVSPTASVLALVAGEAERVEGRVTDADTGEPIARATVSIPDTQIGAATDEDGRYVLNAPDDARTVRVVAPGYVSRLVRLAEGQRQLDVALTTRDVPRQMESGAAPPPSEPPGPDVFDVAEVQPRLIEGSNLQPDYPPLAREAGIEGRVIVQFIVDTDDSVSDAQVMRSPHDMLSRAALETVESLRFEPGRQSGEAVKVRLALPITFRLPEGENESGSRDTSQEQRLGRVWFSGTDLALLANEGAVRHLYDFAPQRLARFNSPSGAVELRYALMPDGKTADVVTVSNTSGEVLERIARFMVDRMRFRESSRPGAPVPATFRLEYQAAE